MRRDWVCGPTLFLVTLAVFSRVLGADFVQWDDDISVAQNPHVQGLDGGRLLWMFSDASYAMRYKPLTWLAYALVHQCCGLSPLAYHLVNLGFHSLNAVLVFVIIRALLVLSSTAVAVRMSGKVSLECGGALRLPPPSTSSQRATLPAALGALLWACQPLRVEPVARITDLTYCVVLFFLMISLWCYLRAWESEPEARSRSVFYGCSVAAYALAMLTYPVALGWALVLIAVDWYPLRRFELGAAWWRDARLRGLLREKIPFVLWGALALATLFARRDPSVVWAQPAAGPGLDWFSRGMQAAYVWAYYVWKPWVPFHLSPVYTTLIEFQASHWRFWLSAGLVAATTALLIWKRHRWPWALVLWASYLTLLLPALGLTEHPHYTSDRYDYLAGLVWALVIAAILWKLSTRPQWFAAGAVCAIAVAGFWAVLSFEQTRIWRNTTGLFEYMVHELGEDPRRAELRRRLGGLYAAQGRTAEAVQQFQTSLRQKPDARTYQALAEVFERNGNAEAALTNYLASLELTPDAWNHLRAGTQLSALGRTGETIGHYRAAFRLRPNLVAAIEKLAWLLSTASEAQNRGGTEALPLAEQACALSGQSPAALGALAAAYAEVGRFREAVATAPRARDSAQAAGESNAAEKSRRLIERFEAGLFWRE
jgi:protein O-mannosyl-transferase